MDAPGQFGEGGPVLSVVVPAYREGPTIYKSIGTLLDALVDLDRDYEILVVSDGNVDETAEEASRHGDAVQVLHYDERRGKGYALRYGAAHARGDVIAFIDADMELHPEGIVRLLTKIDEDADVAVGSKRHSDSMVQYPFFRRFQSAMYQYLVSMLFDLDLTDTQTGLKVFRADLLRETAAGLTSDGFSFDLELLVELRYHGARIVEGPVQLDYQFATTTNLRTVFQVLRDTMAIWWRHRRRVSRDRSVHVPNQEKVA